MAAQTQLSKFLALALRHTPQHFGLALDEDGWTETEAVRRAIGLRFGGRYDEAALHAVVAGDEAGKQRYEFSADGQRIRARFGHSEGVCRVAHPQAVPPAVLYHGTTQAAWALIAHEGLQRGRRSYVHLAQTRALAETVAQRRLPPVAILQIDATRAHAEGIVFYRPEGEGETWLVKAMPPLYLHLSPD